MPSSRPRARSLPPAESWLIVLARDPQGAKSRLGEILATDERALLATALLEDVLDAVYAAPVGRVVVATESDEIRATATRHGVEAIAVAARGMSDAARDALAAAVREGASAAAVLPADLPALRAADVSVLFSHSDEAAVTIAPDRHRRGTNALVLRPPGVLTPLFGHDSFRAHQVAAQGAGLSLRVVERPGLALDIDNADDLSFAIDHLASLGRRSAELLSAHAAARR